MRLRRPAAVLALLAALAGPAAATVIEVDVDGAGDFATIQEGLDAAAGGDTVLVHQGTYAGPLNRNLDFAGKAITLVSVRGAELTVIECELLDIAFLFDDGEGSGSRVDGFTVNRGAGAVSCVASSPVFVRCAFENCDSGEPGGAVYCEDSSATFEDCFFGNNRSFAGGALYCARSPIRVRRSTFLWNLATSIGGAVHTMRSDAVIDSCLFDSNRANSWGGAIWSYDSADTIRGCEFLSNGASDDGGALGLRYSEAVITGSRFSENRAQDDGGAVLFWQCEPSMSNCEFTDNVAESVGGAILYSEGHGELSDCTFAGNEAGHGGAVHLYISSPSVTGCEFRDNGASSGGAVYAEYDCGPLFERCTFVGNTADYDGGGLYIDRSTLWMTRCTLAANAAGDDGGGVRFHISSGVVLNSIMAFSTDGEGAACHGTAVPRFEHCCVFGNAGGDSLCGHYSENVFVNPGFCDPPDGDLSLRSDSACLPEGNPWGEAIGAHGWGCGGSPILSEVCMVDGAVAPWETAAGILLELPEITEVTVRIYDFAGRLVASPYTREVLPSGVNLISWNLKNDGGHRVASGTYFCVVETGGSTYRRKIAVVGG
jgi:hypothetical protein